MKQHRYEEARQCFLSCLAKERNSMRAMYRMACLEANVGHLYEARKWATQALDCDPFRSELHYTLALVHEVQGELQEAVHRLKKVIYLDPHFILAHFGLFHLYQRTGDSIGAERHRTVAVHLASKLSPDTVLPGSDDLTAGQLLTMAQVPSSRSTVIPRGKP
jgi:chemotaxis protein methyltransferase CheR